MVSRKNNYRLLFLAIFLVLAAIIAYTIGYNRYLRKYKHQFDDKMISYNDALRAKGNVEQSSKSNRSNNAKEYMDDSNSLFKDETKEVISQNYLKIDSKTTFTSIVIDKKNKTTDMDSVDMPLNFVGFTKGRLAKYYDYYMNNLPTEEMGKGLLSIRIIKFSKEEVVIQKIYDESTVLYYITENDGFVKIYYVDKKTLYENTGISIGDLPAIEQKNIEAGMFVENKDELISILEGYSS